MRDLAAAVIAKLRLPPAERDPFWRFGVDNRWMRPAVYILTNKSNRVLYVGVTADLRARLWIHSQQLNPKSFSARYKVTRLVYYEAHATMEAAITREKQLKGGSRAAKVRLIERANPEWRELSGNLLG